MPETSLMDKDVLHERRGRNSLYCDPKFFLKLANDSKFSFFAKLDCSTERPHPLHATGVIKNLSREQATVAPVQA